MSKIMHLKMVRYRVGCLVNKYSDRSICKWNFPPLEEIMTDQPSFISICFFYTRVMNKNIIFFHITFPPSPSLLSFPLPPILTPAPPFSFLDNLKILQSFLARNILQIKIVKFALVVIIKYSLKYVLWNWIMYVHA